MQEQLDRLDKELKETDNAVRDLHANLDAYAKIAAYDWYKPHQDILGDTGRAAAREITPRKSCIELIEELGRDENQFLQLQTGLRKEINLFTGHFDEDNTFKFATKFNDDWEYLRFAEELNDFNPGKQDQRVYPAHQQRALRRIQTYQHGHFNAYGFGKGHP